MRIKGLSGLFLAQRKPFHSTPSSNTPSASQLSLQNVVCLCAGDFHRESDLELEILDNA